MYATIPDLLRLLAVPVFGWAAWRDVHTRRVPNRTWLPLGALALALLLVEGIAVYRGVGTLWGFRVATPSTLAYPGRYLLRVAISVGFIVPLTTAFWYMGGFGGADAKAFYVLAVLFPTYPTFVVGATTLPLAPTPVGVFSLTVLSNTVVVGAVYPLAVAVRNLLGGNVAPAMVLGRPIDWADVTDEYGMLLETPSGFTRRGLDLDALRMYLQWRGVTLADLRAASERLRDPSTLPADPNPPGDGGLAGDGGQSVGERDGDGDGEPDDGVAAGVDDAGTVQGEETDDPWGAAAFLDDIDHSAYGTRPATLRDGLDVLVAREEVWVSPGIPFLVPTAAGLVLALTYGDVLFTLLTGLV